jgi:hypothetical protein
MIEFTDAFLERFWSKVEKTEGGCWNWMGIKDRKGYGVTSKKTQHIRCHRMSYRIAYGDFPNNLHVLHKCDNPSCVNPSHLFLGTNADNMKDKCMKGRQANGERSGGGKITKPQVIAIRELYKTMSTSQIAKQFNVSYSAIRSIVVGKTWKHLPILKYNKVRINYIVDKAIIKAYIEKIKELVSKMDESAFIVPPTDD